MKFNDIVMMIHPDIHPEIENAGDKMIQVVTWRDNEDKLEELAIRWGLIESTETFEVQFTLEEGKTLKINNDKYVIVDIINNKDSITVVTIKNSKIFKFERSNVKDQNNNFYVENYTNIDEYMKCDMTYQCLKGK